MRKRGRRATGARLQVALMVLCAAVGFLVIRQSPTEHLDHGPVPVRELSGDVLTEPMTLGIPTRISVVGAYVIVIDIGTDSALHAIDRTTGLLVRSFGRRGGGPGELEGAWSIDPVPDDPATFWVYDLQLKRASRVSLDAPAEQGPISSDRYVHFVNQPTLTGPVRNRTGTWFSLGFFPDGRLGVFDDQGTRLSVIGHVPPGPDHALPVSKQHFWQATLVPHPDRGLFAAIPRYGSEIQLLRYPGGQVVDISGPVEVLNTLRPGPTEAGATLTRDTRFGYIDGSPSTDGFFALFSGRTTAEFPGRANFGRYVHFFDWSGQIVQVLRLDHDALSVAVDLAGESMYVLTHEPFPAIVWYRMPLVDQLHLANLASQ